MKRDFKECPACIDQGRLFGFKAWQEYVAAVPAPLVAVIGYKSNGKANVTMQSWCAVHGDRVIFASVERGSHMYGILRDSGGVVVNFPTAEVFNRCMRSIEHNGWDEDEIAAVGLTAEQAKEVHAPRITECPLSLECTLLWEHEAAPGSSDVTVCMRIVNVAVEPELCKEGRYGKGGYLYNIRSRGDPETGEKMGPEVGVIESLGAYENLPS